MIDAFNEIYQRIADALRAQISGIFVTGEYPEVFENLPCATIIERDNATYTRTLDGSKIEKHAQVMYEISAFSNAKSGKRSQCQKIITIADEVMQDLGFIRTMCRPIPNYEDTKIYRIVARYEAVISTDHTIYRR